MGFAGDDAGNVVTLQGFGISPRAEKGIARVDGFLTEAERDSLGGLVDVCVGSDREGFPGGIPPGKAGIADRCVLYTDLDGKVVAKGGRFTIFLETGAWIGEPVQNGDSGTILIMEASAYSYMNPPA